MAYSAILSSSGHGEAVISSIHYDILEHHILCRLDARALTSLSCTSSYFHSLLSQEKLWRDVCFLTWPSVNHPRVLQIISPAPRSFFSDSFPLLIGDQPRKSNSSSLPLELISAVDIWYRSKPIFSRVLETETGFECFLHSCFRLDLLDPKEVLNTCVKIPIWDADDDMLRKDIEQNLTLSWIIIDPSCKKAANFSSLRPVSVETHWVNGEVKVQYAIVLGCDRVGLVECKVVLICGGWPQGELCVREAYLHLEDMDSYYLNGHDSLVSLTNAIQFGKRGGKEGEERRRHEEYLVKKTLMKERKVFRERVVEMACIACVSIIFVFSSSFLTSR